MGTSSRVPQTRTISGDELSADDAMTALRRYGRWNLVKNSFVRFRYADGFSHSRALALQLCLSFIPLVIALVGLAAAVHQEKAARVIIQTVAGVLPGKDQGDMVEQAAQRTHDQGVTGGQLALWLGLLAPSSRSRRRWARSSAAPTASTASSATAPRCGSTA